jgi:hypothetical protein
MTANDCWPLPDRWIWRAALASCTSRLPATCSSHSRSSRPSSRSSSNCPTVDILLKLYLKIHIKESDNLPAQESPSQSVYRVVRSMEQGGPFHGMCSKWLLFQIFNF